MQPLISLQNNKNTIILNHIIFKNISSIESLILDISDFN